MTMIVGNVFALLLLLAMATGLLATTPAHADSEARQGADWVRITALPCTNEAVRTVILLSGEDPGDYLAAQGHFGGQDFAGCYRPITQSRVILLRYEDGDGGIVPFDALKPLKET